MTYNKNLFYYIYAERHQVLPIPCSFFFIFYFSINTVNNKGILDWILTTVKQCVASNPSVNTAASTAVVNLINILRL